jgi:hypothetical protein
VGMVWSALSLLMMLALAGGLIFLSRRNAPPRPGHGRPGGPGTPGRASRGYYTPLGYAFTWTLGAVFFTVSGLIGYRLGRRDALHAATRWSDDYLWNQIWMGLAMAVIAAWFWRRGLRDLRSNVYVPELAGRDAAAPPSRRIERR